MKINVQRFVKKQLAAILLDLLDGEIDDKIVTANILRQLANEIERS